MKRRLYVGFGLALLCTACLPGSDGTGGEIASGPTFATAATLGQMLVGKTTFGNFLENGQLGNAFCDYYGPDGTVSRVELIGEAREASTGTYTIEDETVCAIYPDDGGAAFCQRVVAKQSTGDPNVWGGDFYGPDGTVLSRVVTAVGNQLDRCH